MLRDNMLHFNWLPDVYPDGSDNLGREAHPLYSRKHPREVTLYCVSYKFKKYEAK